MLYFSDSGVINDMENLGKTCKFKMVLRIKHLFTVVPLLY